MIRRAIGPKMTRLFAVLFALLFMAVGTNAPKAQTEEPKYFWDLKPRSLRLLVSSAQVMVTRTATGWDAYCRCPVALTPSEIPDVMKKAITAVEDKRYFEHRH